MLTKRQIKSLTPGELAAREKLLAGDFYDSYLTLEIIRDEVRREAIRWDSLWKAKQESDMHFAVKPSRRK